MHARAFVVGQAGRTRIDIVHMRHQVADFFDAFDAGDGPEPVDQFGGDVFAAGQLQLCRPITVRCTASPPSSRSR